jgi:hypothetical protein
MAVQPITTTGFAVPQHTNQTHVGSALNHHG